MSEPTPETDIDFVHGENDDRMAAAWVAVAIVAVIVGTAALYFGKEVLLPLATAAVLSIIFGPVMARLELYFGRFISAAIIVLAVLATITGIGYFLTVSLTNVADQVSGYSDNIGNKIAALEKSTPLWVQHVQDAVSDVQRRVQHPDSSQHTSQAVVAVQAPSALSENLKPVMPILDGIVNTLLVIMLLFFLLYGRMDLRDRFVRLAARARITIAVQAIDTAGATVGRYLLLFSIINLGYGICVGTIAWILGIPSAPLYGVLAFLLRYIPYVGATTAAVLPTLVAFALFPGWGRSIEILAAFVGLDLLIAQIVEPLIIGPGIDVSPVVLLISAMYWSWLWGLPGLLLATPLTGCLKVAGDYIPALGFLSILLGAERDHEDYHDYYRLLLELDAKGARAFAIRYCDKNGLQRTFYDVILPAVVLMGEERVGDRINPEVQELIIDTSRRLITELGNRFVKPPISVIVRVLGVMAPGDVNDLELLTLVELSRQDGVIANFAGAGKTSDEICDMVKLHKPDFLFLSCMTPECLPDAIQLTRDLRTISLHLTVIAVGSAAMQHSSDLIDVGCSQVCANGDEARRSVRRYKVRRARSRTSAPAPAILRPIASSSGAIEDVVERRH